MPGVLNWACVVGELGLTKYVPPGAWATCQTVESVPLDVEAEPLRVTSEFCSTVMLDPAETTGAGFTVDGLTVTMTVEFEASVPSVATRFSTYVPAWLKVA